MSDSSVAAPATASLQEARKRLGATFKPSELVWLVSETYDQGQGFWHFDVLRQGGFGRWVRQRYRFDEAADVLYFLGELQLSDDAFRAARATSVRFPVVA